MAFSFPSNPTNNQTYSGPNGVIYTYDGVKWNGNAIIINGIGITDTTQTINGVKTFSNNIILSSGIVENVYNITDSASVNLSPVNGGIQKWTLGASRTPIAPTNWNSGAAMTLMINDGTGYAITWTTMAVTWVGGTAPILSTTGWTVIVFWKVETTIYGSLTGSVA